MFLMPVYVLYRLYGRYLKECPELDAQRIWNCNKSGFPINPSKEKVICEKVFRNTQHISFAFIIHITVEKDYIVTSKFRRNHL